MPSHTKRVWWWGLTGIALSVPAALALESLIRWAVLPPELDQLRQVWGAHATALVWGLAPIALGGDLLAFVLQRRLQARAIRLTESLPPAKQRMKRFEALMISASVAQIPGLLAASGFMLGADLSAVLVALGVSTLGVFALGATLRETA